MAQYRPRNEFTTALTQIAAERGVSVEVILETIKAAILAAYKRDARERNEASESEEEEIGVDISPDTGEAKVFIVKDNKKEDITPPGFSRIAAQTAKQVILQKIREAEKTAIVEEYSKRVESLVSGMILRFEGPNIIVDIGKAEAIMPPTEQVRSENYHPNQRLVFYLKGIEEGVKGPQIIVSRAAKELVQELFKREVPEISNKAVEIAEISREPGVRTKMAVFSNRTGIDPVGSCVGQRGVRVNEVINELMGEKIDIIQYNEDPTQFIATALAPADGLRVEVDEKKKEAKVFVPEDKLSLAIGKEGQNARLAAKLTGYKIDIVGEEGKKEVKKEETKEETKKEEVESEPQVEEKKEESKEEDKTHEE